MDAEKKDTPRTDAFEKQRIVEATTNDIATEAWADFARQLERELAARNEAYDRIMNNHSVLLCERDSLRKQNDRLVKLLEQTRHYSIGPLVPTTWFMERDKALAAQPVETK